MLNLLFDATKTTGIFTSVTDASPLKSSVHWLKLDNSALAEPAFPANPTMFDVENAPWQDLGPHGTLFLPPLALSAGNNPANIALRLAPDPNAAALPANTTLELVISFGRPLISARTPQSSPFKAADSSVQTAFHVSAIQRNTTNPLGGNPVAWFFPLGVIATRPPAMVSGAPVGQFLTDRYEFSLGAIVTIPGMTPVIRHFGEDPEMDIGQ